MNVKILPFLFLLLYVEKCLGDSTRTVSSKITFSGYAEVYYAYDFGKPVLHERPFFLYNHKRHNEVNLNLGYLKAAYQASRVKANLALMAGTYAHYNMAAEQGLLKNILEANVGLKLLAGRELWLEAGIFSSSIGMESAVSKDCWTLTRSIMAENTPYFLSGAKLTYVSPNQKWLLSGLMLNGWQRIQRPAGNNTPAFGTQVTFKPSSRITINSSTFAGNDRPDSSRQMRYFHNLYGIIHLTKRIGLVAAFDAGIEQKYRNADQYNEWYNFTGILRYSFSPKLATAFRYEYYHDRHGVIIPTNTPNGFETSGYSLNLDFAPFDNILLRIEGRMFESKDHIFLQNNEWTRQNYQLASSIAVSF